MSILPNPHPFSSSGLPADIELIDSDGWPNVPVTDDELNAMEADFLADLAEQELQELKREKPAA